MRKVLKISESKNGVVLVITYENCLKLGFNQDSSTAEVISFIKNKLEI